MDTSELGLEIAEKLSKWQKSQENQTDGYEYEKSFDELMKNLSKDLLQKSVGEVPENRREKKK